MATVPDAAYKVPLMFQAQVDGRCQLQYAATSDAERWADEWVVQTYPQAPGFDCTVQTRSYTLSWRFVTNSGQDDGVIRPVIGAKGWPFYPGSSMKGVFRRACTPDQADRYCGQAEGGDFTPGILRFHGGYPVDTDWTQHLVDIVHPQQKRQVMKNGASSAFVQISLYKPTLQFGISSIEALEDAEWQTIWSIWEKALATGIGCRVSAGYGQPEQLEGDVLYWGTMRGRGQASKLLNGTPEFRPNIFRAAIRGHALRIFGGLTNEESAEALVDQLFGGVRGSGTVGLLAMAFQVGKSQTGAPKLTIETFTDGGFDEPVYDVTGELRWLLTRPLPEAQRKILTRLIADLTRFAMLLGGFGKSWRRADHRLFYPDYYDMEVDKPLIGCHWQWVGKLSQMRDIPVRRLEHIGSFIDRVRTVAQEWMQLQGVKPNPKQPAPWREAWHPDVVQVWGRMADSAEDCEAIRWLHGPYRKAIPGARVTEGSIYRSSITGRMGQIGRLWHRMYPLVRLVKDPDNPDRPKPLPTTKYFELLTLFPDNSPESRGLLEFLTTEQKMFTRLWPIDTN